MKERERESFDVCQGFHDNAPSSSLADERERVKLSRSLRDHFAAAAAAADGYGIFIYN